jgi:hypothetical protein
MSRMKGAIEGTPKKRRKRLLGILTVT